MDKMSAVAFAIVLSATVDPRSLTERLKDIRGPPKFAGCLGAMCR